MCRPSRGFRAAGCITLALPCCLAHRCELAVAAIPRRRARLRSTAAQAWCATDQRDGKLGNFGVFDANVFDANVFDANVFDARVSTSESTVEPSPRGDSEPDRALRCRSEEPGRRGPPSDCAGLDPGWRGKISSWQSIRGAPPGVPDIRVCIVFDRAVAVVSAACDDCSGNGCSGNGCSGNGCSGKGRCCVDRG
ncbi:MAG: hypothetical protein HOA95_11355 [Planctomycetes bacterium]|nr:hypothetical protein [Planctomycetota bacterium]